VKTAADALAVVDAYCLRWRIEEFHRTWKNGNARNEPRAGDRRERGDRRKTGAAFAAA
jgi:hypothetical protein